MTERDERRRQSLIAVMRDNGYTISEFSAFMYLSYQCIRMMVKGKQRVSDKVLQAISFRFCIPYKELLEGEYVQKNTEPEEERFRKIGLILKRSRKECGYSQMDVANMLDVDVHIIQKHEEGKVRRWSRREMFMTMAALYKVDGRIWYDDSVRNQYVEGRV